MSNFIFRPRGKRGYPAANSPPTYLRVRLERGVSLLITGEHISIFLNTSNQIFKDKVNKTLYPPSLELFTLHESADRERGILATGGFYH